MLPASMLHGPAFPRAMPLLSAVLVTVGLVACAPDPPAPAPSPPALTETAPATESPTESPTAYPMTIDNCGFEVTFEAPPERIVTIKSTSTELVLALGLGNKIVATAFSDGPFPDYLSMPEAAPPVLSEREPGSEAVLAVEPDAIIAGWESMLTAETAGDRADLAALGIATYVPPAACQEPGYQPNPLTFEDVFDGIIELGTLLGEPAVAAGIVEDDRDTLAAITPDSRGLTTLWYSSAATIPFVGGGIGAPQLIMDAAGLTNIHADVNEPWASVAWEAIAAIDPDVIVLVDSTGNPATHKIEVMRENPVTAEMSAVKNERFLIIPFPAAEAGIRTADAAADLAAQLHELP